MLTPLSQEGTLATGKGTEAAAVAQAALTDDPEFLRGLVERAVQEFLAAELAAHLAAAPYERAEARKGYRNGYKPRQLHTRVGTLTLRVPQDRAGTFSTPRFARYQRTEKALVLALMEMYAEGVSTWKVSEITEALCGTSFSKSQLSALAGALDADLAPWRERSLAGADYPYLCVAARYAHVRQEGRVVSQGVLVVAGVRDDGRREILAVGVADTESAATYQDLFRRLKQRGLAGVRLVTSDDHAGLRAASARHCQGARWQRCQVHFARNLLGLVGAARRRELGADLRRVFAATTRAQATAEAAEAAARWRASHPRVATMLEEELGGCLTCLACPPAHQPRLRTTNGLERLNQELKRRTRVVRIFPNAAACLRLVTALCAEQSDEWVSGRRYLDMEELASGPRAAPAAAGHAPPRRAVN